MNTKRVITAVAAALVVGVVAGNVVSGWAVTSAPRTANLTATTAPTGLGLRMGSMMAGGARLADVVAKLTGLSTADVIAKRTAGTSYAAIAAEKGVTSDEVVTEALKVRETILTDKVKTGTITQTQADAALVNMKARLTERVSATDQSCTGTGAGAGMGAGMGRGGRGQGRGMGGSACIGTTAANQ